MQKSKGRGFIIAIVAVLLSLALIVPTLFSALPPLFGERSVSYSDGWMLTVDGVEASYPITLPYNANSNGPNDILKLSKMLPSTIEEGQSLLMRTSQQEMTVSIDHKQVYIFERKTGFPLVWSPGSAWHMIDLPVSAAGKEITITLESPYSRYASEINSIEIGNQRAHIIGMLQENGLSALIGIMLILLGVFVGAAHFVTFKFRQMNKLLLYTSWLSLSIGVWILGESKLVQLVYNNPLFIYMLTFVALFMLPIPFCKFVVEAYRLKRVRIVTVLCQIHIGFLLIALSMQLIGFVDLLQMLPLFHVLLCVSLITVFIVIFIEYRNGLEVKGFFIGMMILVISSAADLAAFYMTPLSNAATFTQFGLVLFVIMMMLSSSKYLMELNYVKATNDVLIAMAYRDMLTGLYNRTAYEEDLNKLGRDREAGKVTFMLFDIDGLKEVNDQLGHEEGDIIIRNGASCIELGFEKLGNIYRIGGDEFIVIAKRVQQTQLEEALDMLQKHIDEYNEREPKALLSISHGMAHYESALGNRQVMNEAIKQADAKMYSCKSIKKQKSYAAANKVK